MRLRSLFPLAGALLLAAPLHLFAGWLGVTVTGLVERGDESGVVLLEEIVPDGPADTAGLKAGDRVLSFSGVGVDRCGTLVAAVRAAKPGSRAEVVVLREGQRVTLTITPGGRE